MRRERTFILGSGFSASFGLPTLRGLFGEIMRTPDRDEGDVPNVHSALPWFYPHFRVTEAVPNYPPFEQFLSLVAAARDLPSFDPAVWPPVWKSALRLLTVYFMERQEALEQHPLLLEFARRLEPGDTVVTFNWDSLVERALRRLGKPFDLLSRAPDRVTVLKLHGSISWVRPPEGLAPTVPAAVVRLGHGVLRTVEHTPYNVWVPFDEPPLIVTPVASKAPLRDEFLAPLWMHAALSIGRAASLAVIGYSMPDDDLQARALLCTSSWDRGSPYMLVDPDDAIARKYSQWLAPRANHIKSPFGFEVLDELLPPAG